MRTIKWYYKVALALIGLSYLIILINYEREISFQDCLQLSAIYVALFTGILAVSISDKRAKQISFQHKIYPNTHKDRASYNLSDLHESLRPKFKKYGESFNSYQVYFKITNTSKFVLKKPTITLRIPNSVKHPSDDYLMEDLRSNLFNDQRNMQRFEFANTTILSNSNIPFLHPQETIKVWVRMILSEGDTKLIGIHLSLDSENAEGKYEVIKISPQDLLKLKE